MNAQDLSSGSEQRKQAMKTVLAQFQWPVEELFMREAFEVSSDPGRQVHTVCWPRQGHGEPTFYRYLHEMGHALLAERVHPQFSRPVFLKGQDPALRNTYLPLFEAALDWFVEGLLMDLTPEFQVPDIEARFRQAAGLLRQGGALPSLDFVVDTGLALASFRQHCHLEFAAAGKLGEVLAAYLRIPPDKPSLFALHGLVRSLMKVFELHTACLVRERGFQHWRIEALTARKKA